MRLMIAGLSDKQAAPLWAAVEDIVDNGGTLKDWTLLEQAVEQAQPDVAAVYLGGRPGQVLAMIKRVRAMYPNTQYIAMTEDADRSIVQSVTEAGCADIVVLRECPGDIQRAMKVVTTRDRPPSAEGEVISVMGAKGGVGTTVVAANLSAELAARGGSRVIMVDLHLYLGDAAVVLDIKPRPSVLWFLQRGGVADARTWSEAPPLHRSGFRLLGLEGELTSVDPVSAEQIVYLVEHLKQRYDFVILDVGSEVNEVSLAACSTATQRMIVVTDDLASRTGARRRVSTLRELDLEGLPARAVLNRALELAPDRIQEIEGSIGMPIMGSISNAWRDVQGALERGQVLRQCAPRSTAARDLALLADAVAGARQDEARKKRTFFNFFR